MFAKSLLLKIGCSQTNQNNISPDSLLFALSILEIVQLMSIILVSALELGCGRTEALRPLKNAETIIYYIKVTGPYKCLNSRKIFKKYNDLIRRFKRLAKGQF
jgi:hypothetical protein